MNLVFLKAEFTHDGAVLAMWKLGDDTNEIAKRLGLRESEVANRLARLRDAGAV
jgi:DNA-binding Lrp family transcriptional regulator